MTAIQEMIELHGSGNYINTMMSFLRIVEA